MNPQFFFVYALVSLLVGYLGRNKTLKFWGHFLVSFLLSPILGVIVLGIDEWLTDRKAVKVSGPVVATTH